MSAISLRAGSGAFWLITLAAAASFVLTPYFVRELSAGLKRTSEAVRGPDAWVVFLDALIFHLAIIIQCFIIFYFLFKFTWSWLGQVVCMESAQ